MLNFVRVVHLIIISEGGPLPWTLLCCFGIAGPLGLWRFLAAPPSALGGAVVIGETYACLEGWILGHQLGLVGCLNEGCWIHDMRI